MVNWSAVRKHWKAAAVVVFLCLVGGSYNISGFQLEELNSRDNVPVQNAPGHWVYNGQPEPVLQIYSLNNMTTDHNILVSFWYNTTYLVNVTHVIFCYFNGTHSWEDPGSKTDPTGVPNGFWWTFLIAYTPNQFFVNRSRYDPFPFSIGYQAANTSIEYRIVLRVENATTVSYPWWGGNFTVRHSDSDNVEHQGTYATYWNTVGNLALGVLFILGMQVYLVAPKETDELKNRAERISLSLATSSYPSVEDLVKRAEAMEDNKRDLRTVSGILIALAVAYYYFIRGVTGNQYLLVGLIFLILLSLGTIVISLGSSGVTHEGKTIDDTLLPTKDTAKEFPLMLGMVVVKRARMVSIIKMMLQLGVFAVLTGVLADWIAPSLVQVLDILASGQFANTWTIGVGQFISPIAAIAVLLLVASGLKLAGVSEWEFFFQKE